MFYSDDGKPKTRKLDDASRDEMERLQARPQPRPAPDPPDQSQPEKWWDSVLADPRVRGKPGIPIQQRRLSEIPRQVLRVECLRCFRIVEVQRVDAVKLYGPHAVWKDVGQHLLDDGCRHRTGSHVEDGCWPDF